ncbi:UDP-glucose 6-dehydrogenase [Deferribacter desulfuricans SSM1]|uniref:UDP-glucose 6-dehydrogenase n=1 Tax=Deferribacter desulfuricans (strain DSM 14783 / JCM 11476 / NBRC 101012 / SSM1) TaxID=639282 RepID=D3PAK4_DEFDS|nr:UDP-glucose/GDP-mannose dehydrogenase family protein [Deferribacter desulfuricans]BAI79627.1 UDP-glucose 6-dehydrogenase [Deferribacter desulfuricans SSM1]
MRIAVVGTGYVGLVTGACLAEFGMFVTCVDIDKKKIDMLNNGEIPIYEPGLDVIVEKNSKAGRLKFTTDVAQAVKDNLVIFIAVGTPPKEDGSADLTYVENVARDIAKNMNGYKVVVNKSTVPVGTGQRVKKIIKEIVGDKFRFDVVSNPEFLREGAAVNDFMRPDRIVIGAESDEAVAIMKDIYSAHYLGEAPFVVTNIETAEMIKYASNAFLALKITFINEIANLCDLVGADVHKVAKAMGMDGRISPKFLHPGPGYGGSCFPKDTLALCNIAKEYGYNIKVVDAAIEANERQKLLMVDKILGLLGKEKKEGSLKDVNITILGLAFKPNTDDMRESPSIVIINELLKYGAKIKAFDPIAMENAKSIFGDSIEYSKDEYSAVEGADCLVIVTEWNQFRKLDMEKIKSLMRNHNLADLRNIYEPKKMREIGFNYVCVGRSKI